MTLPAKLRLNLGCGDDIREGYLNVDFRKTRDVVYEADLSKFPWPFRDEDAEEILMLDFLEHFPYRQTKAILSECWRVLCPNGELVIQVPDAEHLLYALAQRGSYLCNRCGEQMHRNRVSPSEPIENFRLCPRCEQSADEISDAAMMRLYGGQDYPGNFHHTCFTKGSLLRIADETGFRIVEQLERDHQYKNWNFKVRFRKGDPWQT